jgi:hypothetical protein
MNKFDELVARRDKRGSKLGNAIRLLGSDKNGDVVVAVHGILQMLQSCGADIHTLAEYIEAGGGNSNGASLNAAEMQRITTRLIRKGSLTAVSTGARARLSLGHQWAGSTSASIPA